MAKFRHGRTPKTTPPAHAPAPAPAGPTVEAEGQGPASQRAQSAPWQRPAALIALQRFVGNKVARAKLEALHAPAQPIAPAPLPEAAPQQAERQPARPAPAPRPSWGRDRSGPAQAAPETAPAVAQREAAPTQPTWGKLQRWTPSELLQLVEYTDFVMSSYQWPGYTVGRNGKFDVDYNPASNLLNITVKVKFEFPDLKGDKKAVQEAADKYRANYMKQVIGAWSGKYAFKNVREPQSIWGRLTPTTVNVDVQEVKAGEHFLIQAFVNTAGGAQVSGGNAPGKANKTELYKGDDQPGLAFNPAVDDGELKRFERINPSPILFANNSAEIPAAAKDKLKFMATYMKRVNRPLFNIAISGHANKTGTSGYDKKISEQRAKAVSDFLTSEGLANHTLTNTGAGHIGATRGAEWRKVVITPSIATPSANIFNTQVHEFGHMLGLGDEYWQSAGKAPQATHYDLVVKAFGKEYADQASQRGDEPNASVMHFGDDVRIHHYVTFWEALANTTLKKAKAPTKRLGFDDWKFIG